MRFATSAIHIGEEPNYNTGGAGDVVVPIHLASTFARTKVEEPTGGYEYSRSLNPTRLALEKKLAAVENARFGLAFASGMAAETNIILSLVKPGDHVVAFDDLYGGSQRLFRRVFQKDYGMEFSFVDATKVSNVVEAIKPNTTMIWLETPTNPLMKLCDIAAITAIARQRNITTVVDNTFMSPYFQQPLALGADIVVHSTSKYLSGHSDSIGGAIMLNDENLHTKLKFVQNSAGGIMAPFNSYLVLRGMKTLAVRMREHEKNAIQIAQYLEKHPKVARVYYPGLPSHEQYELAKRQMSGFGGMISFDIKGGLAEAKRFLENIHYFLLAESLGGVESLIEHPAIMTHASVPAEIRQQLGINDGFIRMSVGIEEVEDLLEDIENAFKKV